MVPAMGCTEPIALAYGAARAREVLGREPEHIVAMLRKYYKECALCHHSKLRRIKGDSRRSGSWCGGRRCIA